MAKGNKSDGGIVREGISASDPLFGLLVGGQGHNVYRTGVNEVWILHLRSSGKGRYYVINGPDVGPKIEFDGVPRVVTLSLNQGDALYIEPNDGVWVAYLLLRKP